MHGFRGGHYSVKIIWTYYFQGMPLHGERSIWLSMLTESENWKLNRVLIIKMILTNKEYFGQYHHNNSLHGGNHRYLDSQ